MRVQAIVERCLPGSVFGIVSVKKRLACVQILQTKVELALTSLIHNCLTMSSNFNQLNK